MATPPATAVARLTPLQWVICAVAALGFAYDTYALLVMPLVVRPALAELLGAPPNSPEVNDWVGTMVYVPAVAGRHLRAARRISDRPAGTPPRAGLQHRAVRVLRLRSRVRYDRSNGCSSGAAARSSACAWSSWPQSHGCRSCSPIRRSASACSATRRPSARSAA